MRTSQFHRKSENVSAGVKLSMPRLPFEDMSLFTTLDDGVQVYIRASNGKFFFAKPGAAEWEKSSSLDAIKKKVKAEKDARGKSVPIKVFTTDHWNHDFTAHNVCLMNKRGKWVDDEGKELYERIIYVYDQSVIDDLKKLHDDKEKAEKEFEQRKNKIFARAKQIREATDLVKIQEKQK